IRRARAPGGAPSAAADASPHLAREDGGRARAPDRSGIETERDAEWKLGRGRRPLERPAYDEAEPAGVAPQPDARDAGYAAVPVGVDPAVFPLLPRVTARDGAVDDRPRPLDDEPEAARAGVD